MLVQEPSGDLNAVKPAAQVHVGNEHVEFVDLEGLQRRRTAAGGDDFPTQIGEMSSEDFDDQVLVINDEDASGDCQSTIV